MKCISFLFQGHQIEFEIPNQVYKRMTAGEIGIKRCALCSYARSRQLADFGKYYQQLVKCEYCPLGIALFKKGCGGGDIGFACRDLCKAITSHYGNSSPQTMIALLKQHTVLDKDQE